MPEIHHLMSGFHLNSDQGPLGLSTVALIRGENNILVDVGTKARAYLLRESLAREKVREEDINMIILTHAHWDHCQNVDMFPNAKILMHPRELEYATSPRAADLATAKNFQDSFQGREVEEMVEGAEIEPGISILETPGHTRGHISVLVETSQGKMAVAGDALPRASSVFTGIPSVIFWDEAEAASSVKKLVDASRVFYTGHDRAFRLGSANAVQYISGADSIRLLLGHDGIGDVTIKANPDDFTTHMVMG